MPALEQVGTAAQKQQIARNDDEDDPQRQPPDGEQADDARDHVADAVADQVAVQHIHEAMEKCADFSKTTAIGCRFCRHMLNWNCVLSLDEYAPLASKEIGLVDLREFLADQSRDIWVEFLRPATLEVEDALIVYAQRFGELRGGHTDGLKHVFDDVASHRNELVLSYVILHICNKIIFRYGE